MMRAGIHILVSVAALVLLICPVARAQSTYITLMTSETEPERLAAIRYLMDMFSALNEDIHVEVEETDENDFLARLTEETARGHGPTLINAGCDLLIAAAAKKILNTDAAEKIINRIGPDRFYKGALKTLTGPDGRTRYGIPFHGWVQSIWYRADLFEEAGLDPPDTWESILKAAKHFHDPDNSFYGILIGTDTDQYAEQIFTHLAAVNNACMFDARGNIVFNSPAVVETLKFYLQLAKTAPPGRQTWRSRDYYIQGKAAMMFYSSFIMDDLALPGTAQNSLGSDHFPELGGTRFDPDLARKTRPVSLIRGKKIAGYGMINGFGIMKDISIPKLDAAERLLNFLYQPNQYVEWLHMAPGGMMPMLRDTAETEFFMRDPKGVFRRYGRPKIRDLLAGLEQINTFGMVEGKRCPRASLFYVERIIPRMIDKARSGEMTPEEAVAWAQKEMVDTAAKHSMTN